MFVVIVDFSSTVTPIGDLPPVINMEFEPAQVLDAAQYFYACLTYFEAAKKWDPNYHNVTIDCHFWFGSHHAKHITY